MPLKKKFWFICFHGPSSYYVIYNTSLLAMSWFQKRILSKSQENQGGGISSTKHNGELSTTCHNFDYCIRHIFCESNFSRIWTSRHFCEWLNSRSRRRAIMDRSEKSVSFTHLHMHCVLYYWYCVWYTSCILASGSEVNLFLRVVEFVNSTDSRNSRK